VCQLIPQKPTVKCGNLDEGIQSTFVKNNNKGVGIGEDKVFWHDSKREKMQSKVFDLFIFAIRRYSHVNGFTDEFKVTG
jgi:hypothetical protein